jgi:hypothetical protein
MRAQGLQSLGLEINGARLAMPAGWDYCLVGACFPCVLSAAGTPIGHQGAAHVRRHPRHRLE